MLARRLVKLLARVLQLPASHFDELVKTPGAMLRLLKYPAQLAGNPDALGIGAHTVGASPLLVRAQDTDRRLRRILSASLSSYKASSQHSKY